MNLEEAIKQTKELSARKYKEAIRCQFCYENPDRDRSFACMNCSIGYGRLADWLEELKELREYKEKYRWHNIKKYPDDLPNNNYAKDTWFDVILFELKNSPTRLNMQYCKDLGFGFYQSNKNSRKKFITADEANLTEAVAWREVEEFEGEEE